MKGFCGYVAVFGVLYVMCGGVDTFICLLTVFCIVLYLFYPEEWE